MRSLTALPENPALSPKGSPAGRLGTLMLLLMRISKIVCLDANLPRASK
jgi:hypothetical protein